jgi:hypothetical protein
LRRENDDVRAAGRQRSYRRLGLGQVQRRIDVHDDRQESADQAQPEALQSPAHRRRVVAEVAGRAELGGAEAELAHLGQDAIGGHLMAPVGRLADTPRDRRTGDASKRQGRHHASSKRTRAL